MSVSGIRCAIYTRKSSEEGLEQKYNSLHAQRECCAAYARSQASEGWTVGRDRYDDAGFSGATLKRPALQRLLSDAAAGKLDTVLVYKVDRLTRSLSDFARLIEAFEKAGVSFVSVTQAFNTTSSMGRLTLNVLLSFAQFEREVTGERIRDKIAASKAKGMWMGGNIPLGYDAPVAGGSRKLIVNEEEAAKVRLIFNRFLTLQSLYALQGWLHKEGLRSKTWRSTRGRAMGGMSFSRGALRHLLMNRVYLGQITHKGAACPGRHAGIVPVDTFETVQKVLAARSARRRSYVSRAKKALLEGLIFDAEGQPMRSAFSRSKARRLYHYYVAPPPWPSQAVEHDQDRIRRAPAPAIEELVKERVGRLQPDLDQGALRSFVTRVEIHATSVQLLLDARKLEVTRADADSLERVRRKLPAGDQLLADASRAGALRLVLPVRMKVRGGRTWQVSPDEGAEGKLPLIDRAILKRLKAAHASLRECGAHPDASFVAMHRAKAPASFKAVSWAFLAPDIQRAILEGHLSSGELAQLGDTVPLSWAEQRRLIGWPLETRAVLPLPRGESYKQPVSRRLQPLGTGRN